jgi:sulfite exporter TauE/SafE
LSAPELDFFSLASWGLALLAAFGASFHCLGMCGPLRLLAHGGRGRWQYQGGRLLSYLLLGFGAGALGASLSPLLLYPLLALTLALSLPGIPRFPAWEKARARLLHAASASPLLLGFTSGLLPCGLLHLWVAAAGMSASAFHGAALLSILWIGTLPALELGPKLLAPLLQPLHRRFPRALPLILVLLALVPIWLRTQPFAPSGGQAAPSCHHH